MPLQSIFRTIAGSFYSRAAYREAARGSTGVQLLQLAVAVTLVCLAEAIHMASSIGATGAQFGELFVGIPAIHIRDGEASLDPPGRFVREVDGTPFLVLDPDIAMEEVLAAEQGVFLTRTHILVRSGGRTDTNDFALSALGDRVIRESDLQRWSAALFRWLPWLMFPFLAAFSWMWRAMIAAAIAVAGIPLAGAMRATLDYASCFRVMTLAMIPTLVLGGLATELGEASWWPTWADIACMLGYFVFGLAANRPSAMPPANEFQPPPRLET